MDGGEGGTAPPMLCLNDSPDGRFAMCMRKGLGAGPAGALHQGKRPEGDPQ